MSLVLSPSDKKVIMAFIDQESAESSKLSSDGQTLDGLWMGGRTIAVWKNGKITFRDASSKSEQTVQNFIKKETPRNYLSESDTKLNRPFSDKELDTMRKAYASINKIDPASSGYENLIKLLNSLPQDGLKQLAGANIKFVSMLAKNRIKKESKTVSESLNSNQVRQLKGYVDRLMVISPSQHYGDAIDRICDKILDIQKVTRDVKLGRMLDKLADVDIYNPTSADKKEYDKIVWELDSYVDSLLDTLGEGLKTLKEFEAIKGSISKFRDLKVAKKWALDSKGKGIIQGDDGLYWVVSLSDQSRLIKQGYKAVSVLGENRRAYTKQKC